MGEASPDNSSAPDPGTSNSNLASPDPNEKTNPPTNNSPALDKEAGTQSLTNTFDEVSKTRSVYLNGFERDEEFKPTFQQAVQYVLGSILDVLKKLKKRESKNLSPSLGSFDTTLAVLKDIVEKVAEAEEDERFRCYKDNVGGKKDNLVETLVGKLADDVYQIVDYYGAQKDVEKEVAQLKTNSQELKNMPPSVSSVEPGGAGGHRFHNSGSGTQNNATDRARQFNGTTFSGGNQIWY